MLKIKFWRIENVVLMKVLEQGDEIKLGDGEFFNCSKAFHRSPYNLCVHLISKYSEPHIFLATPSDIYINVRGPKKEFDDIITMCPFETESKAKDVLSCCVHAVKSYNRTVALLEPVNDKEIIDVVIAE